MSDRAAGEGGFRGGGCSFVSLFLSNDILMKETSIFIGSKPGLEGFECECFFCYFYRVLTEFFSS